MHLHHCAAITDMLVYTHIRTCTEEEINTLAALSDGGGGDWPVPTGTVRLNEAAELLLVYCGIKAKNRLQGADSTGQHSYRAASHGQCVCVCMCVWVVYGHE